jgi:protein-tyrosine phosphatase
MNGNSGMLPAKNNKSTEEVHSNVLETDEVNYTIATSRYRVKNDHKLENNLVPETRKANDIPESILNQFEPLQYADLSRKIEKNLLPLAYRNKYLFIQLPVRKIPLNTSSVFYEVQLRGYIPVIVHAEQNDDFRHNPNKIYDFVKNGGLVLINASSVMGLNGMIVRNIALKLCKHDVVHFIAPANDFIENELFLLKLAYEMLQKKMSRNFVNYLQENAIHVVNGTDFHPRTPKKFK